MKLFGYKKSPTSNSKYKTTLLYFYFVVQENSIVFAVSLCVQQSAAYALLDLFPIDSAAISSLLEDWTKKVSKYEDTKTSEIIRRLFDFRKRFGMI